MIDDTLENILREIGLVDLRLTREVALPDLDKERHIERLKPGYFNSPKRDKHGKVLF